MSKQLNKFWIGLNQLSTSTGFVWSDGSPISYTNWYPGEPNNYLGQENCVEFNAENSRIYIYLL